MKTKQNKITSKEQKKAKNDLTKSQEDAWSIRQFGMHLRRRTVRLHSAQGVPQACCLQSKPGAFLPMSACNPATDRQLQVTVTRFAHANAPDCMPKVEHCIGGCSTIPANIHTTTTTTTSNLCTRARRGVCYNQRCCRSCLLAHCSLTLRGSACSDDGCRRRG